MFPALHGARRGIDGGQGGAFSYSDHEDTTGSERRRQPELTRVETAEMPQQVRNEFEIDLADETEDDVARTSRMTRLMQGVARQVSLDPNNGLEL